MKNFSDAKKDEGMVPVDEAAKPEDQSNSQDNISYEGKCLRWTNYISDVKS